MATDISHNKQHNYQEMFLFFWLGQKMCVEGVKSKYKVADWRQPARKWVSEIQKVHIW